MIASLKNLIEALRDELKDYGEMLNLLDRQREHLKNGAVPEVSQSIALVREQGDAIEETRTRREECYRVVAEAWGQTPETPFQDLIAKVPPDYQPLLRALAEENSELLRMVRRRARQNHLLLLNSEDVMQQVVNALPLGETEFVAAA